MPTEKQLFNAYNEVMEVTVGRTDELINKHLRIFVKELTTSDKPFSVLLDEFVDAAELREDLAIAVRSSLIQQTAIGYGVIPTLNVNKIEAIASPKKLVEIFGKTKAEKLSNTIYNSIDGTRETIINSLKKSHKELVGFRRTVSNISKELDRVVLKKENLSSYMRELERSGKNLINIDANVVDSNFKNASRNLKNSNTQKNRDIFKRARSDKLKLEESKKAFEKATNRAKASVKNLTGRRELAGSQRKAIRDSVKAVRDKSLVNLQKATSNAVKAKYKSNMQRLVLTENSVVYEQALFNDRLANPLITAVKFNLASSHRESDECDILASYDGFGLGRGVYPIRQQPRLPIHPNGVCFMTSITKSDISVEKADEAGVYKPDKFAKAGKDAGLSESRQKILSNITQQPRVRIDKDVAIDAVTK